MTSSGPRDYRDLCDGLFAAPEEYDLLSTQSDVGPVVLVEFEPETLGDRPLLLLVGFARDPYEAWILTSTGTIPRAINPARRDPAPFLAQALSSAPPVGPVDHAQCLLTIQDYGGRPPLERVGYRLIAPHLRAAITR